MLVLLLLLLLLLLAVLLLPRPCSLAAATVCRRLRQRVPKVLRPQAPRLQPPFSADECAHCPDPAA